MKCITNLTKNKNIGIYGVILLFIACGAIIFYAIYRYTSRKPLVVNMSENRNMIINVKEQDKLLNKSELKLIEHEDSDLILPRPDRYDLNYGSETRGTSRLINKPLSSIVPNNILSGNKSFIPDYSSLQI